MQNTAKKKESLLKNLMIYRTDKGEYSSSASLSIDGYEVVLKPERFNTIDEAVSDIKKRIVEAILTFKPKYEGKLLKEESI